MFDVEIWGTVADWGVVLIALTAAGIAWRQLGAAITSSQTAITAAAEQNRQQIEAAREATQKQIEASIQAHNSELAELRQDSRDQAQTARASLLLELDRDFESDEMQESRLTIRALKNEIEAFVQQDGQSRNSDQLQAKIADEFTNYLNRLWDDFRASDPDTESYQSLEEMQKAHLEKVNSNPDEIQPKERAGLHYQRVTRLLGWLERVGYLFNRNLIPKEDIIRMYDALFGMMALRFGGHIAFRRELGPEKNTAWMKEFLDCHETMKAMREADAAEAAKRSSEREMTGHSQFD